MRKDPKTAFPSVFNDSALDRSDLNDYADRSDAPGDETKALSIKWLTAGGN